MDCIDTYTAGAKAITNLIDLPIAPSQIWLDQFRAGARVITNLIGYPTAPVQIWLADVSCSGLSADEPTSIASTLSTKFEE
ncbi:hypothetical protein MAR_032793 [Mya arenaria]|uniref:Uncharacterized protein n=1 Tax=Mya arenaria TaxID=6604 RepID=A0ABY7GGF6_MYAAR|nr:hypothetical protein MAR_032793 [Mya arenaria]